MMLIAASLSAALLAASPPELELRGEHQPPPGRIVAVQPGGVILAPLDPGDPQAAPGTANLVISWDRIRRITGDFAGDGANFARVAEDAWRARTRLERGDAFAAEPLFEKLFEQYRAELLRGETASATGAVIAEGLLRCRLRRGAHVAAIDPWLALLHVTASPPAFVPDWAQRADLPPVVDQSTQLAPALPPMWLHWPAVEAFGRAGLPGRSESRDEQITARAQAMAALYLHSARMEAGMESAMPQVRSSDSGVQLVAAIVQARGGDTEQRQRARQRLEERMRARTASSNLSPAPAWIEAWCRAGIGRSLVREQSAELRRLGILELLHLPARFADSHPYLAGLALAEAAAALRDLGDHASADILMRQFSDRYPTHPAHDWRRAAGSPVTGARTAQPGSPLGASQTGRAQPRDTSAPEPPGLSDENTNPPERR